MIDLLLQNRKPTTSRRGKQVATAATAAAAEDNLDAILALLMVAVRGRRPRAVALVAESVAKSSAAMDDVVAGAYRVRARRVAS